MAFSFNTDAEVNRLLLNVGATPISPSDSGAVIQFWYFHDSGSINTSGLATLFSINPDDPASASCLNLYFPNSTTLELERWDSIGNGGTVSGTISDGWHRITVFLLSNKAVTLYIDDTQHALNHAILGVAQEPVLMEMGSRSTGAAATYGMGSGAVGDIKIYRGISTALDNLPELLNLGLARFPRFISTSVDLAMWTPLTFQLGTVIDPTDYSSNGWTWEVAGGIDIEDPPQSWSEDDDTLYWPPTQTVDPPGIASAEALGTPSLAQILDPSGIASAEALGTPSLAQTLDPSGIASDEAVGTPSLAQALDPSGIASSEALGTPSLAQILDPSGIASEEALGTPLLVLAVDPAGVASEEGVGTPSLAHLLSVPGIATEEIVSAPALAVTLDPAGVASEEAVGVPSFAQILGMLGIISQEGVGLPILRLNNIAILDLQARIGEVLVKGGMGSRIAAQTATSLVSALVEAGRIVLTSGSSEVEASTQGGRILMNAARDTLSSETLGGG